jgi:hypothetical protein
MEMLPLRLTAGDVMGTSTDVVDPLLRANNPASAASMLGVRLSVDGTSEPSPDVDPRLKVISCDSWEKGL